VLVVNAHRMRIAYRSMVTCVIKAVDAAAGPPDSGSKLEQNASAVAALEALISGLFLNTIETVVDYAVDISQRHRFDPTSMASTRAADGVSVLAGRHSRRAMEAWRAAPSPLTPAAASQPAKPVAKSGGPQSPTAVLELSNLIPAQSSDSLLDLLLSDQSAAAPAPAPAATTTAVTSTQEQTADDDKAEAADSEASDDENAKRETRRRRTSILSGGRRRRRNPKQVRFASVGSDDSNAALTGAHDHHREDDGNSTDASTASSVSSQYSTSSESKSTGGEAARPPVRLPFLHLSAWSSVQEAHLRAMLRICVTVMPTIRKLYHDPAGATLSPALRVMLVGLARVCVYLLISDGFSLGVQRAAARLAAAVLKLLGPEDFLASGHHSGQTATDPSSNRVVAVLDRAVSALSLRFDAPALLRLLTCRLGELIAIPLRSQASLSVPTAQQADVPESTVTARRRLGRGQRRSQHVLEQYRAAVRATSGDSAFQVQLYPPPEVSSAGAAALDTFVRNMITQHHARIKSFRYCECAAAVCRLRAGQGVL